MPSDWFRIENDAEVASPALLVDLDRARENIRRMLAEVGGPERLRPHVKTHKMAEIVRMQLDAGIRAFKCATLAEAEMIAQCGARDVLWAMQPVGPNIARLKQLVEQFPKTEFSALVDNEATIEALEQAGVSVALLLDLDIGMHRTGIEIGPAAEAVYRRLSKSKTLRAGGLHAYDGHIKEPNPIRRAEMVEWAFDRVDEFRDRLVAHGMTVPQVVSGGSPSFAIHARHSDHQCSPGTTVFWDGAYLTKYRDLDFLNAAILLTRVVSKPGENLLCLDLGYKAVAADNPDPRVLFPELPDARAVIHSEEHLTIYTTSAVRYAVGSCLYAIPWHVCPTVALYPEAIVIRGGRAAERIKIAARDRMLSI